MNDWKFMEKKTATASEDFKKNRMGGFRYIDKTHLLAPLLDGEHETTFLLRPRRFGKTLTLSMIHYFMEDTRDKTLNEENRSLFEGLKIMEMGEEYTRQMTSFPVIHLTLQAIGGMEFINAFSSLQLLIQMLYREKSWVLESDALSTTDRQYFQRILHGYDPVIRKEIDKSDLVLSLQKLTEFLRIVTGRRAVVLIDEYDVPLEKAHQNGYYRQMVGIVGPLLQNALKTNSANLQFAVITGCLRIAKEGIYTGLNNPDVNTVCSYRGSDFIGFTEGEVQQLLTDSGLPDHFDQVKEWYDGYRFGDTVIYNPWSVIKYIEDHSVNPLIPPLAYWAGTSGNAIIRDLADHADDATRMKAEALVQGNEISFTLKDDIVYDNLYENADNLFNVMLFTGYLTAVSSDGETVRARIPNREIRKIYRDKFSEWFRESISTFNIREFYAAMEQGDTEKMEAILNDRFLSSMSYFDTLEAFYHGVMLALLQLNPEYECQSNREAGDGRFDIQCRQRTRWNLAFLLEFKVSDTIKNMTRDAEKAAAQIAEKRYMTDLQEEGYRTIYAYGFSFCKKRCRVAQGVIRKAN